MISRSTPALRRVRRGRIDGPGRSRGIMSGMSQALVWYVSYGSNMFRDRLSCYLQGGCPPGAFVTYPGARDPALPAQEMGLELPGSIYFAGSSKVWGGGGMAFYDHHLPGPTPAKAYLVTAAQFADIADQEMNRPPSADNPLETLAFELPVGSTHSVGPGGYETLLVLDRWDSVPMVTFTAPHGSQDVTHRPPNESYLTMLRLGVEEINATTPAPQLAAAPV